MNTKRRWRETARKHKKMLYKTLVESGVEIKEMKILILNVFEIKTAAAAFGNLRVCLVVVVGAIQVVTSFELFFLFQMKQWS